MVLPLEDEFNDILSKAQKGLGLSTERLAEASGVPERSIRGLRRGELDEDALERLAPLLDLNRSALLSIAKGEWNPETIDVDGLGFAQSPFYEGSVNAFALWDPQTKTALLFDTGTDAKPLLDLIKVKGLSVKAVFLTHLHRDHTMGLSTLLKQHDCPVYYPKQEGDIAPAGGCAIEADFTIEVDGLALRCLSTPGHTAGGSSYVISGLAKPVCVVGDALFAGSMGGANISYEQSLGAVEDLLALDPETVLAPGHGPLTTVAQERTMNCFYKGGRS